MKRINRILSLVIVLAMLSGMMISVSAAGEDFTLTASSASVDVGDTVTVTLFNTRDFTANSVAFYLNYDNASFSYNSTSFTDTAKAFAAQTANDTASSRVNVLFHNNSVDMAAPVGEWATFTFTATQPVNNASFALSVRSIKKLADDGVNDEELKNDFTAGSVSVTVVDSPASIPATGISLNKTSLSLYTGNTETLEATVIPANSTDEVQWSSSNESVASVSGGVVTAVGAGSATITATAGDCTAECSVTVTAPVLISRLRFLGTTTASIRAHTSASPFTVDIKPVTATNQVLSWSSSDTAVATVDQTGRITGVSEGTATITVSSTDGSNKSATATVTVYLGANGAYTVNMAQDMTAAVNDTVSIPVTIGSETYSAYDDADMTFSYDPAALQLTSTEISGYTIDSEKQGEVRVFAYGLEDASLGVAFYLKFKVLAEGETTVTCIKAYVDNSENAIAEDANLATIGDPATVITGQSTTTFTVTLPEGLSSEQGSTVEAGSNYIFAIDNPSDYYNYTVSATMGGEPVEVTDNGDRTYTIVNITGDVIVSFTKAGVEFSVTITGDDTTGEPMATYGTDYIFKVEKEEGYTYSISVTINGQEYTGFTGPDTEGNYTIPGDALTGLVVITVTKTPIQEEGTFTVIFEGDNAVDVVNPPATGKAGEDLSFTINERAGYRYIVTYFIEGTGNGTTITGTDGLYTIPGAETKDVTGYVLVSVETVRTYTVTFEKNGPGTASSIAQVTGTTTVDAGLNYTFSINQHTVFKFTVTATIGSQTIPLETASTLNPTLPNDKADYTIPASMITDDILINISWIADEEYLNLIVQPMVNTDGGTVYFIGVQSTRSDSAMAWVDEYDGQKMFLATEKYSGLFDSNIRTYAFLVYVEQGGSLSKTDVLPKLSFINANAGTLANPTDVNISGSSDINDAQLVYDIYNGNYNGFDTVSMLKFFNADVTHDAEINTNDAAAVVNAIA